MTRRIALLIVAGLAACAPAEPADRREASLPNAVLGTWRMTSATMEAPDGGVSRPYGDRPNGLLVFTPDMRFIEVLTPTDHPPFASDVRGEGTEAENRRAMATSIGFFGVYSVDADGVFAGNRVDGSTFPNWVGDVRTREDLTLAVEGDRMTERFTRPDGGRVSAEFERVR